MEPAEAVEHEAAGGVGQESEIARNLPARPVGAHGHGEWSAVRMKATVIVENRAGVRATGPRFASADDAPAGPVGGATQGLAAVRVHATSRVERVEAV